MLEDDIKKVYFARGNITANTSADELSIITLTGQSNDVSACKDCFVVNATSTTTMTTTTKNLSVPSKLHSAVFIWVNIRTRIDRPSPVLVTAAIAATASRKQDETLGGNTRERHFFYRYNLI